MNCFKLIQLIFTTQCAVMGLITNKTDIFIGGIFGGRQKSTQTVELALQDINANEEILTDYNLVLLQQVIPGVKSNTGKAVSLFYNFLKSPPAIPVLLMASFSSEAEPIIQAANSYWNITTAGGSMTSSEFKDREKYPYFFRTCHPTDILGIPRAEFIHLFKWKKVGIILINNAIFTSAMESFYELLTSNNITVYLEVFDVDPKIALGILLNKDVRIIIALMNSNEKITTLCQASKLGMTQSHYVWIFDAILVIKNWWSSVPESVDCSMDQIARIVDGSFMMGVEYLSSTNIKTVTGKTSEEIGMRITNLTGRTIWYEGYVYDAIVAIALGLNHSIEKLAKTGKQIEDFSFIERNMTELFYQSINDVEFSGVTGNVKFSHGERLGRVFIYQVQDSEYHRVMSYNYDDGQLRRDEDSIIIWPDNRVPPDGRRTVDVLLTVSINAFITMTILSCLGIAAAISALLFNIRNRNHRMIKMSSPKINNLILTGCVMVYFNVILSGINGFVSTDSLSVICQVRLWCFTLAFSLAYGSIFSKTWRVHVILREKTERKVVKDSQLFFLVGILIAVEILFLTVWLLVDPFKPVVVILSPEIPSNIYELNVPRFHKCSTDLSVWFPILYAFKGILLLFGVFLAWETRSVKIAALNDSKSIGICIYNVFIMSAAGLAISTLLHESQVNSIYVVTSVCTFIGTTGTLLIIFLRKVVDVVRGVDIGKVSTMSSADTNLTMFDRCLGTCQESNRLRSLLCQKTQELKLRDSESSYTEGRGKASLKTTLTAID